MLICDICKQEIATPRSFSKNLELPYEYSCSAWQSKKFDICSNCERILHQILTQAKCDFVNGKFTEGEK